ncbi:hypothetical protein IL306_006036, partial [Fusarium sp. DS 682]
MAFIARPLLLSILDLQVVSTAELPTKSAEKKHRFQVLVETMKDFEPRYDGVEWISTVIRYIVNLAQVESAFISKSLITDWTDVLAYKPSIYLRLTITMDLSLSLIRLPEDKDFPMVLRSNYLSGANLIHSPISLASHQSTTNSDDVDLLLRAAEQPIDEASCPSSTSNRREGTDKPNRGANDVVVDGSKFQSGANLSSLDLADESLVGGSSPIPSGEQRSKTPDVTRNDHLSGPTDLACSTIDLQCTEEATSQCDTMENFINWEDMYTGDLPDLAEIQAEQRYLLGAHRPSKYSEQVNREEK